MLIPNTVFHPIDISHILPNVKIKHYHYRLLSYFILAIYNIESLTSIWLDKHDSGMYSDSTYSLRVSFSSSAYTL